MPQRPPTRASAPAEVLDSLNLGYNGYTDPTLLNPKSWAPGTFNVFSGAFGFDQRARFATITGFGYGLGGYGLTPYGGTGLAFSSLKYFALPGLSAYLLADVAGKLYSHDTGNNYFLTQRKNPYVDPTGAGSSSLNGPWSREVLQNIVYEMNGLVKQSGRLANAATIENFGIDAPDASPQVVISAGATQNITAISRSNGIVSATLAAALTVPGGNGIGFINVVGVTDTSFNGTFVVQTGSGTNTLTWNQSGQNVSPAVTGAVNVSITKVVGRSYSWAWENSNKPHVSAPSPSTQFILYNVQNGVIQLIEPGTVTTNGTTTVTGTGTAFTSAWIGRSLWIDSLGSVGRIVAVASATSLTLASATAAAATKVFQVYDPQSTHIRLYETADAQTTYFRVQRNAFVPAATTLVTSGLQFFDNGNSEPPAFPFTTEVSQLSNLPPPIGLFLNEYQGRLLVYGITGALQSFFYSNQELTSIGMAQESFAPLNQVTLPIANGKINGMLEFPGSLIVWSDKQDMFRLTGLLSDNQVSPGFQQGATISRLPYNLGCASPYAGDITPLGGIWLTPNGEIWLYTDRYAPRNIGKPVQDILDAIPDANLSLARAKFYHTSNRSWFAMAVPNGSFNNVVLILDVDLLAANGSPSFFTFDMATNQPSWWVYNVRSDAMEVVYETSGLVRLLVSGQDLIEDIDYTGLGFGIEVPVSNSLISHPWGNNSAFSIKRPTFVRFSTNQDSSQIGPQGWTFQVQGIDDDFYSIQQPLQLNLYPGPINPSLPAGVNPNDVSFLSGNPDLITGESFRHSPELFRIGGVNFVAGRRLKFQVNFPTGTGVNYQFRSVQLGFDPTPPR